MVRGRPVGAAQGRPKGREEGGRARAVYVEARAAGYDAGAKKDESGLRGGEGKYELGYKMREGMSASVCLVRRETRCERVQRRPGTVLVDPSSRPCARRRSQRGRTVRRWIIALATSGQTGRESENRWRGHRGECWTGGAKEGRERGTNQGPSARARRPRDTSVVGAGLGSRRAALESCSGCVGVGRRHSGAQRRRIAGAGVCRPAALC
jgi:hypothetical protein